MKYTRVTALAAVGVAATLSLTACNGTSGSTSSKGSSSSDGVTKEKTEARAGTAKDTAKTGGKARGKTPFCRTEDLAIDAKDAAPDESAGRINITMVNRGSATCSATGFPGVDIKDADNTSSPIGRGRAEPRITELKPGDSAVFNLAYAIDAGGDSLAHPTDILVTPPNETRPRSLKWPKGAGAIKGAYTDVEVYPTHTVK
ncbi:DUF4232 domain-containing protein [Streptomyces sp. HNM0574]|uniref:DUF4232 domain-containing protein n=1 Tax=Streptomyces sp. HNM0574 TaxID=2714954 RepID=UPI00146B30DD|nr:DUF4232 domain-containing protein [Streptomyces sp. HNM0574]